jgi:hypothetical protein
VRLARVWGVTPAAILELDLATVEAMHEVLTEEERARRRRR